MKKSAEFFLWNYCGRFYSLAIWLDNYKDHLTILEK